MLQENWKMFEDNFHIFQVEELEKNLSKANNNVHQKQLLIDGLNQSVDKLKRKVRIFVVYIINWSIYNNDSIHYLL